MTTEAAVRELREELGEIAAVEGCAGCECLLGDEARGAEADVQRLLAAGKQALHSCLECDPCLPVEPYRRFRAALAAAGAALSGAAAPDDTGDGRADAPSGGRSGCCCDGCG